MTLEKRMTVPEFFTRVVPVSGLALIAALSMAQAQRAATSMSQASAKKARTSSGCRPARRWSTRCSTWPRSRPHDYLVDLGSGDGRTVITAAKRGAKALGIEYNPDMVELSKRNAAKEGVSRQGDLHEGRHLRDRLLRGHRRSRMFLLPNINVRLRPKILDMKPGTRVVVELVRHGRLDARRARAGDRRLPRTTATLCSGSFPPTCRANGKCRTANSRWSRSIRCCPAPRRSGNASTPISGGKMTGDQIAFTVGDTTYTGRVNGNTIEGTEQVGVRRDEVEATRAD